MLMMKMPEVKSESRLVVSDFLRPHGLYVAHQAPLSMEFSRQEYWSGLPFPSPVYLPNPGIEPGSPALQADSVPCESLGEPLKEVSWSILINAYTLTRRVPVQPSLVIQHLVNEPLLC